MKKLSTLTERIFGQPMFQLKKKIREKELKGEEVLHFEIGDASWDCPKEVIQQTIESLNNRETHYTASSGMVELKQQICKSTIDEYGFSPNMQQILVAPANSLIDFIIRCICDKNDEVIVTDPCFPTYNSVLAYTGVKRVPVRVNFDQNFQLKAKDIEKAITKKTKLIVINSPCNPTGSIIEPREMISICNLCAKNKIYLLTDEVYSSFLFERKHFWSPCIDDECKERTILLKSFSKTFSMTGFRLGYCIGPESLIEKMSLLFQTIFSCMPVFVQRAGIAALSINDEYLKGIQKRLVDARDTLIDGLMGIKGIEVNVPQGAFYAFPKITGTGLTSNEFADKMLEECGVALLPGNCFGENGEGFVRICYATDLETIQKALKKMREVL